MTVTLVEDVHAELHRRTRAATAEQRSARRARIILACEGQRTAEEVGREVHAHPSTVERWRLRFVREGLAGLEDRPRPGRAPKFTPVQRLEIVARACEPIFPNQPFWTTKDESLRARDTRAIAIGAGKAISGVIAGLRMTLPSRRVSR